VFSSVLFVRGPVGDAKDNLWAVLNDRKGLAAIIVLTFEKQVPYVYYLDGTQQPNFWEVGVYYFVA
jgi:glycosidase